MKYLVAVSGGVDSVVLLDMLHRADHHLIVAHVDHGIRGKDSAADERFVAALATHYNLPFVSVELNLGAQASEELARKKRYEFLLETSKEYGATLVTAHHQDDLVETVALNLARGTGWRGLAVLDRPEVYRPLLAFPKSTLYNYALTHHLEWVEDATNATDVYHRNRLRKALARSSPNRAALYNLRSAQLQLKKDINREAVRVITKHYGSRYFLNQLDESVALELLGTAIVMREGVRPTRPQLRRALHAVKTALPHTTYHVARGISLQFTARNYLITVV